MGAHFARGGRTVALHEALPITLHYVAQRTNILSMPMHIPQEANYVGD